MTVTNWRPLTRSLSYYFSWVPGGISKCSKLSKCKTIYYSWFQLVALPPILQLQSELVPWFCLLTASSPRPHLLTWPCLSMLYIEIPSCNFHFQYLGWCQCHLCFGFYINHLSMSLTLRCCGMLSHFSRVWLFGTPSTVARQALLATGFSRQEYWRQSSPPRDWTQISCVSCIVGRFFTTEPLGKPKLFTILYKY